MPSIVSGFEYDIFISYRHNDNRSGWVSEFVTTLQEELAATIKEPLSIYFDKNPQDGLLEIHNVDKSLEGKLRCIIFIPIISQTYCDPKSFAWQYEFCAFLELAGKDQLGRDIKLGNGNVMSRMLPIKIHELDSEDKLTIENKIGEKFRAIEFIYKEPGVNRPLKITDSKSDNQNKTDYRNQVNKLANAIKDIILSVNSGSVEKKTAGAQQIATQPNLVRSRSTKLIVAFLSLVLMGAIFWVVYFRNEPNTHSSIERKRIAILPFKLIGDKEGEYFASGMKDVLIRHLRANENLLLPPSLTSTERFAETTRSHREIAEELKADFLVEAAAQKWGDSIRLSVELIDPHQDKVVWSQDFRTDYFKVFEVQEIIASGISNELGAALSGTAKAKINRKPTENIEAYDLFLQAKQKAVKLFATRDTTQLENIRQLITKAMRLDPNFAEPYIGMAATYFVGGINTIWKQDTVEKLIDRGLELYPQSADGLNLKSQFLFFHKHDTTAAVEIAKQSIEQDTYNRDLLMWVGWLHHYWFNDGSELMGLQYYLKAYYTFPDDENARHTIWNIGIFFTHMGDFSRGELFTKQTLKQLPDDIHVLDHLARLYFWKGDFTKLSGLIPAFEKIHREILPNDYTYLQWKAILNLYTARYDEGLKNCEEYLKNNPVDEIFSIYTLLLQKTGNKNKAEQLWREAVDRELKNVNPDYFIMARCYAMLGEKEKALAAFEKVRFIHSNPQRNPFFCSRDLMFESLRQEPRFSNPIKKEKERLESILERISMMEKERLITIPKFIDNR